VPTLVLRLSAPLQAWPGASRRKARNTEPVPTYSALNGLVRAAQGLPRLRSGQVPEDVLRAAVRVDRPGRVVRDFHTINPIPYDTFEHPISARDTRKVRSLESAAGAPTDSAIITSRFYVADACYTVLLDDPHGRLAAAFDQPGFALSAGRKSCPFADPVVLGTSWVPVEKLLSELPTVSTRARPLEVHLFHPPETLKFSNTQELWDTPAGEVAQEYRLRRRYITHVSPPAVHDIWDQISFLNGHPDAPVPE
jgi:CRISPR system Cascade subunit CasD